MSVQKLVCSLAFLAVISRTEASSCYSWTDCASCTSHTGFFQLPCHWCPLSQKCHVSGSWFNACGQTDRVSKTSMCKSAALPKTRHYNQTLAKQLASWASLAYVKPASIDPSVLRKFLRTEIPGQYKILTYIQKDCDIMVDYSACSLLVAISEREKNIIVSFEGTQNMDQLFEQLTSAVLSGLKASDIGGEVLYYNHNVHRLLYPCLKDYLSTLLRLNPTYTLTLTGHSLGGAQAQLAAAAIVFDKLIKSERVHVYTFGAPRFANSKFASRFDKLVPNNWRLVQAMDPVPRIPPYFVYHTHSEVWYSRPGIAPGSTYIICKSNEDEGCALSQQGMPCFGEKCVRIHKSYFLKDIGTEFSKGRLTGSRTPSVSLLGNCTAVSFANS